MRLRRVMKAPSAAQRERDPPGAAGGGGRGRGNGAALGLTPGTVSGRARPGGRRRLKQPSKETVGRAESFPGVKTRRRAGGAAGAAQTAPSHPARQTASAARDRSDLSPLFLCREPES